MISTAGWIDDKGTCLAKSTAMAHFPGPLDVTVLSSRDGKARHRQGRDGMGWDWMGLDGMGWDDGGAASADSKHMANRKETEKRSWELELGTVLSLPLPFV
jgi:hypothetical protein